jgi:hypothetical protein
LYGCPNLEDPPKSLLKGTLSGSVPALTKRVREGLRALKQSLEYGE